MIDLMISVNNTALYTIANIQKINIIEPGTIALNI